MVVFEDSANVQPSTLPLGAGQVGVKASSVVPKRSKAGTGVDSGLEGLDEVVGGGQVSVDATPPLQRSNATPHRQRNSATRNTKQWSTAKEP